MRRGMYLLGRTVFGGFFLYSALNHFRHSRQMSGYAASKGTPAPQAAVLGSGGMLLLSGLSLLAGIRPRQGLMLALGFLIPVSLQMHRFWDQDDPAQYQAELVNFMKNMALAGAALTMMEMPERWPISAETITRRLDESDWTRPRLLRSIVHRLAA